MPVLAAAGPLAGLRVIEFAGIGPGPHCAMLFADLGAEILRFEREGGNGWPNNVIDRGRHSVVVDIKSDEGQRLCLAAAQKADVVIEGYRPGVMEGNGLGPEELMAVNPRLIYGRMTGWGQQGPLARSAGHDINYIALSGALASFGRPGHPPPPPLNLVGDFGGGSLFLAFGIVAALFERDRSGLGQVVDAAIVDGMASMMAMFAGMKCNGPEMLDRETSMLGGAAPFYRCYECADGRFVSVGAIEPKFYAELITRIGAPQSFLDEQMDVSNWSARSVALEKIFRRRTCNQWCALLEGTDACFAPVLSFDEAVNHPHAKDREMYRLVGGSYHQAPAPRFGRTRSNIAPESESHDLLGKWGIADGGPNSSSGSLPVPQKLDKGTNVAADGAMAK